MTQIANFWFDRLAERVPNHRSELRLEDILSDPGELAQTRGRSMIVRRLQPLPVEAVVRGYLIGSGWKDYQRDGAVCGLALPPGLRLADRLPQPLYTPSTKAELGQHDENISFEVTVQRIGAERAARLREISLEIYRGAAEYAASRGIIIADTKFEILTPDSSRYWPADQYRVGTSPPSFDKQFVRDYLETLDWDKTPPGPELPASIVQRTLDKYRQAVRSLTGQEPSA